MSKKRWEEKIREACNANDVYRPSFEYAISVLASTLDKMDVADKKYRQSGSDPVVLFSNGNSGMNSYLKVWHDLNSQAMKYFHELGITPAGLKAIDDKSMKKKKKDALAEVLSNIG